MINQTSELQKNLIFHAPLDEWSRVNGPELVTNGDFSSDTWWNKDTGVTISSGKCNFAAVGNVAGVYKSAVTTSGKIYVVSYTVIITTGSVRFYDYNTFLGVVRDVSGTYSETYTSSSTAVGIVAQSTFTGTIDNISVREVNYGTIDNISKAVGVATDVYPVLDRSGSGRRSLEFNGVDDYVSLPSLGAFGTSDFSITAKIKLNQVINRACIIGGQTNSFGIEIDAGGTSISIFRVLGYSNGIAYNFAVNTEYTIGYTRTYGTTTGTLYVNGVSIGTLTDAQNYTVESHKLGRYDVNAPHYFSGSISMCRIFNYALSAQQVINYSHPEYPIEWVDRGGGTQLVTGDNSTFASNTGFWSTNAYFTISSNKCNINSSVGQALTNTTSITSGKYYKSVYDLTLSSGLIGIRVGAFGTTRSTSNTYTETVLANSTALGFYAIGDNTIGTIDNVSVTQLGCVLDLNAEGLSQSTSGYWYDKTNGLTATNSGASLSIPSASNLGAMAMNGTSSYVGFGQPSADIMSSTKGTISFWVNNLVTSSEHILVFGDTNANEMILFGLELSDIYIVCRVAGTTQWNQTTSADEIPINTWKHVALVQNGVSPKLYINGVDKTTGFTTTTDLTKWFSSCTGIDNIRIGCSSYNNSGNGSFSNAIVSNINVYKEALDIDRIKLLHDQGH